MKMPFGKYRDQDVAALPLDYVRWVIGNIPIQSRALDRALRERLGEAGDAPQAPQGAGAAYTPAAGNGMAQGRQSGTAVPEARYNEYGWRELSVKELEVAWTHYARSFERAFGFRLRRPRLEICTNKGILGRWTYNGPREKWKLAISNYWVTSKDKFFETFVHEMCHEYITEAGIQDSSPHGREWKRVAAVIGQRTGFHIAVSERSTLSPNPFAKSRKNVVYVIEENNGKEAAQ